jgi:mono/diheme cytochrome c family protein
MAVTLALLLEAASAFAQEPSGLVAKGHQLFTDQGCYGCHMVGKFGTPIANDLSRVGAKHSRAYLEQWLRDPSVQKPTAHMPKIQMTEAEAVALAAYLASLR